jgi:hypothetical protein
VIVWINGTFGVGKTTIAELVTKRVPGLRLFDPEWVGYMLKANLAGVEVADFQDLLPWRTLVPAVAGEIAVLTGDRLLAVQAVLVEAYWHELRSGLMAHGLDVFHVVLDATDAALRARIAADDLERGAEQWRLDHLAEYAIARRWLTTSANLLIDTTAVAPDGVAAEIVDAISR